VPALDKAAVVGVVGAGTMGAGIAQVAAQAGHAVLLTDSVAGAVERGLGDIAAGLDRLVEKARMARDQRDAVLGRVRAVAGLEDLAPARLVVEAVTEDLSVKRALFAALESIVAADVVLASNTSSLSITALAAGLTHPGRVIGMHFFNPPPLMPLVEVISGRASAAVAVETVFATARAWGKQPVHVRSTPAFIVNRVARPYYGEAFRLLDEGWADIATIDTLLREAGGFRMGPFELIDLIGLDVNLAVTRSVHAAFFGDPRYAPSLTQQDYVDAGWLGRKSGRGFYDYAPGAAKPKAAEAELGPRPDAVLIEGDLGPAEALVGLWRAAGIPLTRDEAGGRGPAIICHDAVLMPTDGRPASLRAAHPHENLVLFDLALDYATAPRLALAPAEGATAAARAAAAGLFQAAGKRVSEIADAPGMVVMRTVAMLVNEAAEVVQRGVAEPSAVDTAMRLGVNYPLGPLAWADSLGPGRMLEVLDHLADFYREDRYRAAPLLRLNARGGRRFHQ